MNQPLQASALASALLSALALTFATPATAQEKGKEKCYGVAKFGQNDCANLSGTHTCAGQSKADLAPDEWKYVPTGTCKELNGLSEEEAKKKAKA